MPTNTAEKLNAISGRMTQFVKKISNHNFFKNKIILKNNRLAHFAVSAQFTLLLYDGIRSIKFKDLSDFFNNNKTFEESSKTGKNVKKMLNELDNIFTKENHVLRNRALIVSFFLLLNTLIENGLKINDTLRNTLRKFYEDFYTKLQTEVEKGANATDAELIIFQSKVSQDADSRESIQIRNNILSRSLVLYNSSFRKYLDTTEFDDEFSQLKIAKDTRAIADVCFENMANLNKVYDSKKGEDLFKLTNQLIISMPKIGNSITTKEEYKFFIDALYKIFYEGSGALKRIPASRISDRSIFIEIKHLRTDLFHDVEHGKRQEIKKKKQIISDIYYKYCAKKTFNLFKVSDLRTLQSKLLINLNNELSDLQTMI